MMLAVVPADRHRRPRCRASRSRARPAPPSCGRPPTARRTRKNTDAWFVAFAPARSPKVAVAVMLVGPGQGGASAAPIARQVLQAAL